MWKRMCEVQGFVLASLTFSATSTYQKCVVTHLKPTSSYVLPLSRSYAHLLCHLYRTYVATEASLDTRTQH
jgi:hypothetical protein